MMNLIRSIFKRDIYRMNYICNLLSISSLGALAILGSFHGTWPTLLYFMVFSVFKKSLLVAAATAIHIYQFVIIGESIVIDCAS